MVEPLLDLDHRGKAIFRMSVNPQSIISRIELGTSSLMKRIDAVNRMCDAGYPCGLLIAPVIIMEGWKEEYRTLLQTLRDHLSPKMKREMFLEVILMTYSFVHRAINGEAFPAAPELYDKELMTGRGRESTATAGSEGRCGAISAGGDKKGAGGCGDFIYCVAVGCEI